MSTQALNDVEVEFQKRIEAATQIILGGRDMEMFWEAGFDEIRRQLEGSVRANFPGIHEFLAAKPLGNIEIPTSFWQAPRITKDEALRILSGMTIMGFNGPIGCGKDTAAGHLEHTHGFQHLAFADALRASASVIFSIPMHYFTERELKDREFNLVPCTPHSPRRVLQIFGTEVVRENVSDAAWTLRSMLTMAAIGISGKKDAKAIITDVRFQNEVDYVRWIGGYPVFIDCPFAEKKNAAFAAGHSSELKLIRLPGDAVVSNDSDLQTYLTRMEATADDVIAKKQRTTMRRTAMARP